ncbi:hypothetical protein ACFQ1L_41350 [Phytohabitans flavus]
MRKVGPELSGAWRSFRYDLARRPARPAENAPTAVIYPEYEPATRPRRLVVAATTLGTLSLLGAAGTYFAVVTGLGALAGADNAPPDRLPVVAAVGSPTPTAQGGSPVPSPTPSRSVPVQAGGGAGPSPSGRARLGRAPVRPAPSPTCACVTPPVPTRTSPPPVAETPDPP